MGEVVYLNGEMIDTERARVSVFDHGFLYGFGLFETMRAYAGRVFRLEEHLNRLTKSAELLGLTIDAMELGNAVRDTLNANGLREARVRITVSAGEGKIPPEAGEKRKPTLLVTTEYYHPPGEETYRRGFHATISTIRRNSQSPLSRLKSANYLESLLSKEQARSRGVQEAILLNEKGFLAEASMSNIFLVSDGTLVTPDDYSGILPGITRDTVVELAEEMGISVRTECVTLDELFRADEVFLTNSLIELMPLTRVEEKTIGSGQAGDITGRILAAYRGLLPVN